MTRHSRSQHVLVRIVISLLAVQLLAAVLIISMRPVSSNALDSTTVASITQSMQRAARTQPRPQPSPIVHPKPKPKVVKKRAPAKKKAARKLAKPVTAYGFDISWPQCTKQGVVLPPSRGSLAIVGITGGKPFTVNPCLAQQWRWAKTKQHHSAYINLAYPKDGTNPFTYGAETATAALAHARAAGMTLSGIWLDVETANYWSTNTYANYAVIRGAISGLKAEGVQAGIYTAPRLWGRITANRRITVPFWLAVYYPDEMRMGCGRGGIGMRKPDMVQAVATIGHLRIDYNMTCTFRSDLLRAIG